MSVIKGLTLAGAEGFDYSRFIAGVGSGIEQEGYNAGYVTPDMGMPSFALMFEDLGGGAVNTKPIVGAVAATFTRAGATATTIGPTGLIIPAIGANIARAYYDPTTLQYQGYLPEGARTNICLQSEDLATTWFNGQSTETVNATAAPDGAITADKLVEDASVGTTHQIAQTITYTNAVHTLSVFAKASERTWASIYMFDGTTTWGRWFNLSGAGTVGAISGTPNTATITAYPNGWYRLVVTTNTAAAAAVGNITLRIATADSTDVYNGNGTSGLFYWGAQLEAATFASTYIPTTVASVTRNADVLTYPITGWLNTAAGTLFASFTQMGINGAMVNFNLFTLSAATYGLGNGYLLRMASSTSVDSGGNDSSVNVAGTYTVGTASKAAAAYQVSNTTMIVAANGAIGAQGATLDFTGVGTTKANIGSLQGDGTQHMFGTISRITYFPAPFPQYLLRQLTS